MKKNSGLIYINVIIISVAMIPLVKPTELSFENPQWLRIIAHVSCMVVGIIFSLIYLAKMYRDKLNITIYKYKGWRYITGIFWGSFILYGICQFIPEKIVIVQSGYILFIASSILFVAAQFYYLLSEYKKL